ncbi:MAG TPA: amino acid adenylation domain-containing protein [Herpetosiphonaceae bacterium]
MSDAATQPDLDGIAIIGMAGRFPGARNIRQFWENLCGGVESLTWLADDEIESPPSTTSTLKYVNAAAVLDAIEQFDAAFFGFNPREAEMMDPQHRLFLEAAWEALEDAGYDPNTYDGSIGVFASTQMSTYLLANLLPNRPLVESMGALALRIANDRDFLPTRVSYKLNLRGPSMTVVTACSSSLVATHLACQSLLDYQSDMVLVGGVAVNVPQRSGYVYQEGGLFSPDGHCRAFDADAQGTFTGNGLGIVVLKRLEEALNDGDQIYAVIKGSAINNDGSSKVGYTAPSVDGQAGVILAAQIVADVDPRTIGYIETHGAGTPLGDPIEIAALTQAFRVNTEATGFCAIGSVKTNVGHLDSAAGVTGLIKAILALKHRQIPPSLNCAQPNPAIDFPSTPFYVNTELRAWEADDAPRRAGVSSFGVGGTNAHVILEEAPPIEPSDPARPWQVLVISARTATALHSAGEQLLAYLREHPAANLADVAYTLQVGRRSFDHRQMLVCRDTADAIDALTSRDPARLVQQVSEARRLPIAFMFAGLGDHYLDMGLELYQAAPVFRETIDRCAALLKPELGLDLREVLYPRGTAAQPKLPTSTPGAAAQPFDVSQLLNREPTPIDTAALRLNRTDLAQPILFALEYALAQQWIAWGVEPQALIGHSLGEYVAATLAGVFALPDALRVVAARARLIQSLPGAAMLTVMLSEHDLQPYLGPDLALAAVNSPLVCVVAGDQAAVDALEQQLYDEGIGCRRLSASHAFHSHLMEPILERFVHMLRGMPLQAPEIPFVSNVTGTWITAEEATSPRYWARHLRQTVRFADGVRLLWSEPGRILIEVGPGQSLSSMARQQPKQRKTDQRLALPTLRTSNDPMPDRAMILSTFGKLWLAGVPVDWAALYRDERRQRLALPTYPFERQRYWLDPPRADQPWTLPLAPDQAAAPTDWVSVPFWREALPSELRASALASDQAAPWLVVADPDSESLPLSRALIESLSSQGQTVHSMSSADTRAWLDSAPPPASIIYFWNAQPAALDSALDHLHRFAQRLAERAPSDPVRLAVVTTQLHDILGETSIDPASAGLHGLCAGLNAAYPRIQARTIDIAAVAPEARALQRQARLLLGELMQPTTSAVAYRGGKRWLLSYEPAALDDLSDGAGGLRQGGVYLLTGDVEQIGAEFVEGLVQRWSARVALVVPPSVADGAMLQQLSPLIERRAAVVLLADQADPEQMQAALAQAEQRYGRLDGWLYGAHSGADSQERQLNHTLWRRMLAELTVVAQLCAGLALDTVVVCAPLADRLGGQGLSAAIGSAVLDAFVRQQGSSSTAWLSIYWDAPDDTTPGRSMAEHIAVFDRILRHGSIGLVLVSPPQDDTPGAASSGTAAQAVEIAHARPELSAGYVAPRNATEAMIVAIWEELLGISPIGVYDDFFELGGHSLLATRLLGRLHERLRVELPLNSLFVAPTVARLSEQIAVALAPAAEPETIPPAPRDQPLPLSFAQQRLWLLHQIDPHDVSYNMPFAVRVSGPLDVAVLARSIQTIVERHETLRTTFVVGGPDLEDQPQQQIAPAQAITLIQHDLSGLSATAQQNALQPIIVETARQPFDLRSGPLLRVGLVRLSAEEHVVYLVMHHIISDGWSMGVFVRELLRLYELFRADEHPEQSRLPALPVQYADYALWQRAWLRDARLAEQLAYWTRQLDPLPPVLALPTDRPRPPIKTHAGRHYPIALDAALTGELKQLSQRQGVTLYMTLLAAFLVLLQRWTGQHDLVVGAPIAGRSRPELEGLIGFFVNTLVLRTDLGGNPAFVDLLQRVRDTTLGAYAHQDLPFERLVEELRLERDLSYTPLVQVMCALQNTPFTVLESTELTMTPVEFDQGIAQFDLMLALTERADRLVGIFEYNTDLFEAATIARMAGQFQTLLEALLADPHGRLSDLSIVPAAERQQMVVDWNRSEAEYPRAAAVHTLIEAQAVRTPDVPAIVFAGAALTYAELNTRANQLAHYLRAQGVGPDVLVALCVERSLEMIVGMLAILKAGGAYLPLDPAYPQERLQYMLSHSRSPVLLTQAALVERLPEHPAQVFRLDVDWPLLSDQPTTNPARVVLPDHLAYLIFTSGSTGRPKGVMVTQRGLINLVHGLRAYFADPQVQHTGLITSISFDISVNQIFPTLIFGRTLHIIPDPVKLDSRALLRYLDDHQLHLLDSVPSYLHAVLNEVAPEQPPNALRYLLIGGEKLEQRLLEAVFGQLGPQVEVVNIYGLTEISDINALGIIRAHDLGQPITVGKPLQNNRIYILDQHHQPQPVGIAGEVCVAGASVSRGYLYRPDLTAERFVSCPFEDGQIMVRTGDLGRWLPDGTIEILGRIDQQVKIRGFRIEPGEIEAVLASHPHIRECAVVAREDGAGDQRLVAYVVTNKDAGRQAQRAPGTANSTATDSGSRLSVLGAAALRAHVGAFLPDYMIPSAFVVLDALPRTPNGKLDRKTLPAPDLGRSSQGAGFVAPSTPTEELLAGIWTRLLDVSQVSIDDNFFELGGHSLLATRVVSRLRETFQVDLSLRTLFEAPTIATLARQIDIARRRSEGGAWAQPLPPLTPQPRPDELPLSFAQQRLWLLDQINPGSPGYNIPAAIRLRGRLDEVALAASFTAVVARHEALRTTFARTYSGQARQIIGDPAPCHLTVIDLQHLNASLREVEVQARAQAEAAQPFDLSRGPLLRTTLLRLEPEVYVLLITMHHIVSDGWSIGVLIGEVAAHYAEILSGAAQVEQDTSVDGSLPLPVQYADYALWQRAWLRDARLAEQLAYWTRQLDPLPPVLALPTDRPRPSIQTFHGRLERFQIDPPLVDALKQLGHQHGATLYMTLLAAFQTLLFRYTRQTDIVVGSPIAGRTHAALEGLIGLFVNTLVLRTDLGGSPAFVDLLRRVRDTTLGAYAHQDLPFELLMETLHPERDLSHHPLFQVMFVLQNTPLPTLHLDDLSLEPITFDPGIAKFDLTLNLAETTDGLAASFEYNTDLFDGATIERMARHFQTLLQRIVDRPEQPITALPLLDVAERQQVLAWKRTPPRYAAAECLPTLFAAQAARTPEAIAAVFEDQQMTYAALDRRADQLAHYLRALGVGGCPLGEVCVGLCVDPSLDVLVGILGILKAGGAYVPLDPAYPRERLAFMLADSRSRVLLTQRHLLATLPEHHGHTVCLDQAWPEIARHATTDRSTAVDPDQLAYVIYTSGSTGAPKGVMVSHRGLSSYLQWAVDVYRVAEGVGAPVHSSLGFDLTVTSLLTPLLCGRSVWLLPQAAHVESLTAALNAGPGYSIVKATPAHLDLLRHTLADDTLNGQTRALVIGGEALRYDTVDFWRTHAPGTRLINEYGPTEAVVGCCIYEVAPDDPRGGMVPIGRPTANTQIAILDPHGEPVPIGVAGEIYLGGAQLARGYLNRPALTAETFVPDPFGVDPGARLYRTGDLARYLPDGTIEYLGRSDQQIKLHGYRIEPGEIEAVLRQHEAVREAAVVVREERGAKRLVAYVVPNENQELRTENQEAEPDGSWFLVLGSFLRERLPAYMVPSAFVVLDALPLTPNGKLDLRALPAPSSVRPEPGSAVVAPRTPTEQALVAIWQEVLGRTPIGIHDTFFALGGDSIRSIAVVAAAQRAGLMLTVQQIFQHQTIAALAPLARAGRSEELLPPAPFSLISRADRDRLPASVEDAYPLTQLQMGMLFHSQYHPEASVYHTIYSYQLHGPFDKEVFAQVAQEVVDRHAVIRTAFEIEQYQEPLQLVYRQVPVLVLETDLRSFDEQAQEAALDAWMEQERRRAFDWSEPPLARFYLHRRAAERFHFSFSFHHAILDGWSVALLLTELFQQYMARLHGTPLMVEPLQTHFGSFVALERAARESAEQQAFWSEALRQRPTLSLPLAATPQPYAGPRQTLIEAEVAEALRRLASEIGVPLRSVLLMAHLAVLRLIGGERTVITGLVTNGRPETPDGERLLGLFLNSVPFQMTVDRRSWRELIRATFAAEQQLLPFRRYPLAQMQRDLSGQPLFDVLFNFVHFHAYQQLQHIPGLKVVDQRGFVKTNFALNVTFSVSVDTTEISLELDYDVRLGAAQADRLIGLYLKLLKTIVAQPDRGYSAAALLSQAEHERLLGSSACGWSAPSIADSAHQYVHALVAAQVERAPDSVSVICDDASLSYAELDRRANQLAHMLQRSGIGPESRVGVCLAPSPDLVVVLLAVLKAGGVYLPLDPSYPASRLQLMLHDAQASLVLTATAYQASVSQGGAPVICLDLIREEVARLATTPVSVTISPEQLAYIIYTSGSTGQPKGVGIAHAAAAAHLHAFAQTLRLSDADRLLQFAALGFDVSIEQMLAPLVAGAAVILRGDQLWSLAELMQRIVADAVSVVNLPTAYWQQWLHAWLEQGNPRPPAHLRLMIVGGEALPVAAVQLWQTTALAGVRLLNAYGPTETTITATLAAVGAERAGLDGGSAMPIGMPLPGRTAYVLDDDLEPVPEGVAGELYLGGVGIARGYLGRPDLTAEKFVPDPFSQIPGARLYRTGDRALVGADRQLAFIGRADQQVKLRGFRIELGEIEAALRRHPAVREAAVVVREDTAGQKSLVAYIVGEQENKGTTEQRGEEQRFRSPTATEAGACRGLGKGGRGVEGLPPELRAFLGARLPEYMVPSAFVVLDALPLTPSGKLDRTALPAPEQRSDARVVAPRDTIELRLVQLWEDLLDVRPIGLHDSFFELGGDSILAVRLMAQIQRLFGQQMPLATLFQARTIEQLASLLRQRPAREPTVVVPIQPHGTQPPFFFVHPVGGNVLAYVELARQLGRDHPLYGLQALGLSDAALAHTSIETMATDYIAALRAIQQHGPYHLGGWSFGGVVAFEMARQLGAAGEHVAALVVIDSDAPTGAAVALDDRMLLGGFARDLGLTLDSTVELADSAATQDDLFSAMLEHAQRGGLLPPHLEPSALRQLFAVFKSNLLALQRYVPRPYAGSITLFVAAETHSVRPGDPRLGWADLAGGLVVHALPADHYTILKAPCAALIAAALQRDRPPDLQAAPVAESAT